MPFGASNASENVVFRYPTRLDTFNQAAVGDQNDVLVADCLFAPGEVAENDAQANQVVADAMLYAPPESPAITARDQVVVRGETYEVIGKPRYWMNEGYEISLRRVTG